MGSEKSSYNIRHVLMHEKCSMTWKVPLVMTVKKQTIFLKWTSSVTGITPQFEWFDMKLLDKQSITTTCFSVHVV